MRLLRFYRHLTSALSFGFPLMWSISAAWKFSGGLPPALVEARREYLRIVAARESVNRRK